MHIVISDDYQNCVSTLDCFALLKEHRVTVYTDTVKTLDDQAARFADADAIVIIRDRTPITRELLARLPKLKIVAQGGGGAAHIDQKACAERGVTVCVPGTSLPHGAAELTWALLLASSRRLVSEINRHQAGQWQGELGRSVKGQTLGLIGYGAIAQLVASYAKVFGMQVQVLGHRESTAERARAAGLSVITDRQAFFSSSDFVSLHLRLNAQTEGFVTLTDLLAMKPTAHLINTARSTLIETGALAKALDQGRPGYAAIDVYDYEPLYQADLSREPLLGRANVLCTPHIGFVERSTFERYLGDAFTQLLTVPT
jgi:D-3-phosphoglycerate dehydrogenase / 2-oxoglutarate reductase